MINTSMIFWKITSIKKGFVLISCMYVKSFLIKKWLHHESHLVDINPVPLFHHSDDLLVEPRARIGIFDPSLLHFI